MFYEQKTNVKTFNIPLGTYSDFNIKAPCSLADSSGLIIGFDEPSAFYSPRRFLAQLLSFSEGYVEYKVPILNLHKKQITNISFSLEICSECPMYNNDWKSDITFWLNGKELCTYRSMGDYGGRPGKLTPLFWPSNASQYGILKQISVNSEGTFLDETKVSDSSLPYYEINENIVSFKIGIKPDAKYVGGVNIFGKSFGNIEQNILMKISYMEEGTEAQAEAVETIQNDISFIEPGN